MSTKYFDKMTHAQIVVTVNPGNWEGDFRLWESMCTGALVFVDPIMVSFCFQSAISSVVNMMHCTGATPFSTFR